MQENLFYYGDLPKPPKNTKAPTKKVFSWTQIKLIRESGPWYAPPITNPGDLIEILKEHLDIENLDREHFVVAYLDQKNNLAAMQTISIGSLNSTVVHPREVFKTAVLASAASVILAHNHPSGDPTPSKEDIGLTKKLVEAGEILGIKVLDHIIVGVNQYTSFNRQGLI